ncbi:MAG: YqaE/Pmp3 family membrane protein [Chitinophagales bacterium]
MIRIIIAFFIPPLSVALGRGIGSTFWLNLLLSLLLLLPGIIHALIVIGEDY